MRTFLQAAAATLVASAVVFFPIRDAHACGGCFHAATDTSTSFVTDHRMVVSISTKQTVLWDQVKYTGNPSEFAWVLPVREGTRIELARDEWINTLDRATTPSVKGPERFCGGGGGGGGGCGAYSADSVSGSSSNAPFESADAGFRGGAGVEVVGQAVVGPYESVIVRSKNGEAIHLWLRLNGFAIPDDIEPILARYTNEAFDFLALRLRPDQGVSSMRPVRVVMPGAGATLPLRMVAAGIGARVGLTLFVISEARHHPKNFPDALVDRTALNWNMLASRSNYRELADQALAKTAGRGWLTEYAGTPFGLADSVYAPSKDPNVLVTGLAGTNADEPLDRLYESSCKPSPTAWMGACRTDAGPSRFDAGLDARRDGAVDDASSAGDAALTEDASGAGLPPIDVCAGERSDCSDFDDARVALEGLHREDVWLTRLRAELTPEACASGDLELEPSPERDPVPATLKTESFSDPKDDPCNGANGANSDSDGCACHTTAAAQPARRIDWLPTALALAGLAIVFRKRQRPR